MPIDAAPAPPAEEPMTKIDDNSMMLTVEVPVDAKVYVNGYLTSSTGAVRRFVSRGLDRNSSYTYEVRAEVVRDGETQSEVKSVKVGAGQITDVAFVLDGDRERVAAQPNKTALILHVPADAKVFLAGRQTSSTGPVREFATTSLEQGGEWADYPVRVELNQDGRTLTRELTVSLRAGESRELAVDFDTPQVAANR